MASLAIPYSGNTTTTTTATTLCGPFIPSNHRKVALCRLSDPYYSNTLVERLLEATDEFSSLISNKCFNCQRSSVEEYINQTSKNLYVVLKIIENETKISPELCQEVGCDGAHIILNALLNNLNKLPPPSDPEDENIDDFNADRVTMPLDPDFKYKYIADIVDDISALIYSIASNCTLHKISFPYPKTPLDRPTRISRQPKEFTVLPLPTPFIISQISNVRQSSQDDVGFIMWPSAIILSMFVACNQSLFSSRTIIELGSGCGLTSLVCGAISAKKVIATDYNDSVLSNIQNNIQINELGHVVTTARLDFYDQIGTSLTGWTGGRAVDVVVAADVICKDSDALACARSVFDCLSPGGHAYLVSGTGEHRFGVDLFNGCCKDLNLEIVSKRQTIEEIFGEKNDYVLHALRECAGFVDDMTFWFHTIVKPTSS